MRHDPVPLPPSFRTPALPGAPTVLILAGGLGTRLRSVVSDRPKVLAEVRGRPFLSYWLDSLAAQGFSDVVLCSGYLSDQVERCFGSRHGPLRLRHSVENRPLGTGGALRLALPMIRTPFVLVLNGDSYCDVDLGAFCKTHIERRAEASMVLRYEEDTRRFGRVTLGPDGRLESFLEKSDVRRAGWINAGVYLLPGERIAAVPEGRPVSLERDLLPGWLAGGIHGFPSSGRFIDIGTPESLAEAEEFFAGSGRLAA